MYKIAAHRGGNSWDNLFAAIEKGYDYVELDVHLSCDNYLLVQYSPKVQVNGRIMYIQDLYYNQLSTEQREKFLLLSDVLAFARDKIGVIIDIKHGHDYYQNIGAEVVNQIRKFKLYQNTWMISFDHRCLIEAKQNDPKVNIALMYVAHLYDEEGYWLNANTNGVEICNEYLNVEIANKVHSSNLTLIGWCTKDFDELDWLIRLHTDIITIEQEDCYLNFLQDKKSRGDNSV
ncbi:MAG: glycerophosphodiester phosphodiesterase [Lachnospiraceae bacterium]|nr:glycerophosphodiester phosphodiesterase [Lachnospiraceae bacterium]